MAEDFQPIFGTGAGLKRRAQLTMGRMSHPSVFWSDFNISGGLGVEANAYRLCHQIEKRQFKRGKFY